MSRDDIVDRLRGRYSMGPHLPNGKPEFGFRQFEAPPIQHEAAAEIERLRLEVKMLTEANETRLERGRRQAERISELMRQINPGLR